MAEFTVVIARSAVGSVACTTRKVVPTVAAWWTASRVNWISRYPWSGGRVLRHAQVVEDETGAKAECAPQLGNGVSGFPERLEDTHREAAKARDVFRAEAGTDAVAILIVVPVDEVVNAIYRPVPAMDGEYPLRRGLLRRATRHPQRDLVRVLAGFFPDGPTLDQEHLTDAGKVEVHVARRATQYRVAAWVGWPRR